MLANFTEETCTGTAATLTLAGATTDSIAFSKSFADGEPVSYSLEDSAGVIKVSGIGTYNSAGNTITRNDDWNWNGTVIDNNPSTNITLSGGTHTIRCDVTAKRLTKARMILLPAGTTYTTPADVVELYAFVYGSVGSLTNGTDGGAGGAGYSEIYYPSPAASYTYAIGAGGAAGAGAAGGTTSFGAATVTGSAGVSTTTGGAGGVGSGGDYNATGGAGGNGNGEPGGGGGAASRAGDGGIGGNADATDGGAGGGTGGNNATGTGTAGAAATANDAGVITLPSELFSSASLSFDEGSLGNTNIGGTGAHGGMHFAQVSPALGTIGTNSNPSAGTNITGDDGRIYVLEIVA